MEKTLAQQIRLEEFDVDLAKRIVTHKPSGISLVFDEFLNEADWQRDNGKTLRNNPAWPADRSELARMAKVAAITKGLKTRGPGK